ncbi:hypothetical protein D3C83_222230 [compost metagenome]
MKGRKVLLHLLSFRFHLLEADIQDFYVAQDTLRPRGGPFRAYDGSSPGVR